MFFFFSFHCDILFFWTFFLSFSCILLFIGFKKKYFCIPFWAELPFIWCFIVFNLLLLFYTFQIFILWFFVLVTAFISYITNFLFFLFLLLPFSPASIVLFFYLPFLPVGTFTLASIKMCFISLLSSLSSLILSVSSCQFYKFPSLLFSVLIRNSSFSLVISNLILIH